MLTLLVVGRRRTYLNTQIDDMHLITDIYSPAGNQYRVVPADLATHVSWTTSINSRLPAGSSYKVEIGHNGNGAIENALTVNAAAPCTPNSAIEYADQGDTALEFQKPLGTGTNIWPTTPTTYPTGWGTSCLKVDPLANWFMTAANRAAFNHISHTFTHESLNNATNSEYVYTWCIASLICTNQMTVLLKRSPSTRNG